MEYNEDNAPLSAADRAERWENANFFQKIALFFSDDSWQCLKEAFKESWDESSQCTNNDDEVAWDNEPLGEMGSNDYDFSFYHEENQPSHPSHPSHPSCSSSLDH